MVGRANGRVVVRRLLLALLLLAVFGSLGERRRGIRSVDVVGRWVHDEATLTTLERRVDVPELPVPDPVGLALWADSARNLPSHLRLRRRRLAMLAWRNEVWDFREDGVLAITTVPCADPVPGSGVFHFCEMGRWAIRRGRLEFHTEQRQSGRLHFDDGTLRRALASGDVTTVLVPEERVLD